MAIRMYQQTDQFEKKLKSRIRREFNHLLILSFDELNSARISKETKDMFDRLLEFNESEYRKVFSYAVKFAYYYLTPEQLRLVQRKPLGVDDAIEVVMGRYNFTTGYLYFPEAERKRLRLYEQMMTAKQYGDHKQYNKWLHTGANLWYKQSLQYAIDLEDYVTETIWKDAGVEYVEWIAEIDEKTCHVCRDRDGTIYPIDEVPEKPHYLCRCYTIPAKGEK